MKITDVKVYDMGVTALPGVAKFIKESLLVGPMEPYAEYRHDRTMWTGGTDWTVPLVIISTDEGIEGYGFCGGASPTTGRVMVEHHFRRLLIGADPFDTEMLWDKMFRATIVFGRKGAAIESLSGIDNALWDIKGKALGVPVYKLLGGRTKGSIRLYASNLHPSNLDDPDLELLAREARDYVDRGYTGLKQRACAGPQEGRKGMEKNELLVRAVREAAGWDVDIMIDAYMSWADVDYATQMIRRLDKYDLTWVEEPLLPDDFEGYRRLRSKVASPLAAGEHEFTRFGFRELITNDVLDILQPDIRRLGGLTEAKKVAAMAEAFNIPLAPHVAYAETVHFALACPQVKWAEDTCRPSWETQGAGFTDSYVVGGPIARNGFIDIADDAPGLGISPNMEVVERLSHRQEGRK